LVVLPNELVLRQGGHREAFSYTRPAFDRAKSMAHIAVALFTLTCPEKADKKAHERLAGLSGHIRAAIAALSMSPEPDGIDSEIASLLDTCQRFATSATAEPPSREARAEFARLAGARVLRLTELATCTQVASLHEAVNQALSKLSKCERDALQVVVMGDHQARTRSLGMQYFQRRFGEEPGSDDRVTYGENIATEEEAIALVGTRRLDQSIARAFFGDEKRLQRDVLGDAAKRCIEGMHFDD